MSHFAVLVIDNRPLTNDVLTDILQPWHEFECTGIKDQYVVEVDETEELRKEYETGLVYTSKEALKDKYKTFREFLIDWHGKKEAPFGEQPDTKEDGQHAYGYFTVNADGEVLKVIDFTNPNKKWDWWVVGGRYRGKLITKNPALVAVGKMSIFDSAKLPKGEGDIAKVADLDLVAMKHKQMERRKKSIDFALSFCTTYKGLNLTKEEVLERWADMAEHGKLLKKRKEEWLNMTLDERGPGWADTWMLTKYPDKASVAFSKATECGLMDYYEGLSELVPWTSKDPYADVDKVLPLTAYAVVKDGVWHSKGTMGWFGCSFDEQDNWDQALSNFLDELRPEQYIAVVDCHI